MFFCTAPELLLMAGALRPRPVRLPAPDSSALGRPARRGANLSLSVEAGFQVAIAAGLQFAHIAARRSAAGFAVACLCDVQG